MTKSFDFTPASGYTADMTDPIQYMQRTRDYYLALGYDNPYEWARFDDVPFTPLAKPLAQTKTAIVTTAAPFQPDKGDQGPGAPYNGDAKFFEVFAAPTAPLPDLRISHIAIDRDHTTAEDINSYFPLIALTDAGRTKPSEVFFGFPTNRSKSTTQAYADTLVDLAQHHDIDAAILLPNCPVCHQSLSIAARVLENAGIATVLMGCAKDIVEHAGVPRFLLSDFPLGNAAGRPNDPAGQSQSINQALDLLEQATSTRTTWTNPQIWPGPTSWKDDYSNPAKLSVAEIARRRAEFDKVKAIAKTLRDATGRTA